MAISGGGGYSDKMMDDVAPGWIDVWRLWRHCLCRFGWYPLFVAPLVTCACLLDLYSSTGCDFIRMDIGFVPANDVFWGGGSGAESSQAQLGLFSFDSHLTDRNKWKRSFNNGCQLYSSNFENVFIASDQTWHVSRIMAYISGISSLVALATAWLLTITPLPASFFWPGVLLPAVILSMLTGAAKFLFFDTEICTEPLWYLDETSEEPVAARSCEIGESSVFGIASVAAYFFCTILICFRSPQKRVLDENWGKRVTDPGSTITHNTIPDIVLHDAEHGHQQHQHLQNNNGVNIHGDIEMANSGGGNNNHLDAIAEHDSSLDLRDSQQTMKHKNDGGQPQIIEHGQHTRSTSDVTWSTGSNTNKTTRNLGVLSGSPVKTSSNSNPPPMEGGEPVHDWNAYGRPIVVTINDNGRPPQSRGGYAALSSSSSGGNGNKDVPSLSYSDGSTTHSSSKSPASRSGGNPALPPRHNGSKKTKANGNSNSSSGNQRSGSGGGGGGGNNNEYQQDAGSVNSRISKLSFTDMTHASDELSALGMQSYSATHTSSSNSNNNKSAPSVVNIPSRRGGGRHHSFSGSSPGGSSSNHSSSGRNKLRYGKHSHRHQREDRNDVFSNEQPHGSHASTSGSGRLAGDGSSNKRDGMMFECLPPLDEMSSTRSTQSLEDHGDLINNLVRDLENSFGGDNGGFRTM